MFVGAILIIVGVALVAVAAANDSRPMPAWIFAPRALHVAAGMITVGLVLITLAVSN